MILYFNNYWRKVSWSTSYISRPDGKTDLDRVCQSLDVNSDDDVNDSNCDNVADGGFWTVINHGSRQRIAPVAPGPEFDKLRQAESRRRRRREWEQIQRENDKNAIVASDGIPIDKFDIVV